MNIIKSYRLWIMWAAALAVIAWYFFTDPDHGAETLSRVQWLAWLLVVTGPVYLVRKALMPCDGKVAWKKAVEDGNIAAGIAWTGAAILTGMLFLAFAGRAAASELPLGAVTYLPVLATEQAAHWSDAPLRSALAAQVEQETCPSLKSKKCWNPRTELKTDREYGFGLGQLTVTPRFDNFVEARKLDVSLRDWQFVDRYDPARQLRTLVLMDRNAYRRFEALVPDPFERMGMAFSAYNGGQGGVLADRRLCASIKGCDPARWFGNVERYSLKAKTKTAGYGQSFFEINRGYVRAVMIDRRPRYAKFFDEQI